MEKANWIVGCEDKSAPCSQKMTITSETYFDEYIGNFSVHVEKPHEGKWGLVCGVWSDVGVLLF